MAKWYIRQWFAHGLVTNGRKFKDIEKNYFVTQTPHDLQVPEAFLAGSFILTTKVHIAPCYLTAMKKYTDYVPSKTGNR